MRLRRRQLWDYQKIERGLLEAVGRQAHGAFGEVRLLGNTGWFYREVPWVQMGAMSKIGEQCETELKRD